MSWTEVVIEIAREHAEALSDALMEAGALSVSVEDADEGTDQEKPLFGEPGMEPTEAAWDHSRVVALTDVDADQAAIVAEAAAAIGLADVPKPSPRAGGGCRLGAPDAIAVRADPHRQEHLGRAELARSAGSGRPDPGTRSGPGLRHRQPSDHAPVHGMAGSPSGAGQDRARLRLRLRHPGDGRQEARRGDVTGVDIDPQAIESARDNAERNRCEIDFYVPDDFVASKHANGSASTSSSPTSCRAH
jgi:ribosomal protein L11 methyltransferase